MLGQVGKTVFSLSLTMFRYPNFSSSLDTELQLQLSDIPALNVSSRLKISCNKKSLKVESTDKLIHALVLTDPSSAGDLCTRFWRFLCIVYYYLCSLKHVNYTNVSVKVHIYVVHICELCCMLRNFILHMWILLCALNLSEIDLAPSDTVQLLITINTIHALQYLLC